MNPRASRTQLIVASVPLLTIRTFSTEGTIRQIASAISTSSGFGVPKLNPSAAAARTASMTGSAACPKIAGPQVPTKSINSLPSTVTSRHPRADLVKNGSPPTPRNARTGEFTPPGMRFLADSKSARLVIIGLGLDG